MSSIRHVLGLLLLLPMLANAQTVEYIHTDSLGSPVAVTDAAGNVIERSEYEPYGALLNRPAEDRPGYTGHVMDSETGLVYMQQRYYDPLIGRFLSVDPVTANPKNGTNFNRYWYANNNPYKFIDPDGRAPCTGTRIGTCVNGTTVTGLSERQLRDVKRNPQAYINRLNQMPNKQSSEAGSARYFARTALPVTATTGREVGADIAKTGDGYTVANYALGAPPSGDGSGSVASGQVYTGPGTRVAIIHTHPANTNFSGLPAGYSGGRWTGYINYGGDLERSVFAGANAYVVMLNGGILKFDYQAMAKDAQQPGANLNAESYISRLP